MNHSEFKELIFLYCYNELSEKRRSDFEQHLSQCAECRLELEDAKKFLTTIGEHKLPEPSEQWLSEVRKELKFRLRLEKSKLSLWEKLHHFFPNIIFPKYKLALSGIGVLVVGFMLGYMLSPTFIPVPEQYRQETSDYKFQSETFITNLRFLEADAADGEIEFTFDAVTPVRMKGSINNAQIQNVLAYALVHTQNPGVRLRMVNALAAQTSQQIYPELEVRDALIDAVKNDPNPAVRREALNVLQKFQLDKEIFDAFLAVLMNDKNPGLRVAAMKCIEEAKFDRYLVDESALRTLRQKMETDDNNYIRLRAKSVLEEIK